MENVVLLSDSDNVGNAVEDIAAGSQVTYIQSKGVCVLQATDDIPFGFKIAIENIPAGGHIIKYGEIIGRASKEITPGELVHIHNVEGRRGRGDLAE